MAIRTRPKKAPAASPAAAAPFEDGPRPGRGGAAPDPSEELGALGEPAGDLAAIVELQGEIASAEQVARDPVDEAIRRRAYEIWESEGRPDGRDREHWSRAQSEVGGVGR
jgi:hypothetical protein